MEQENNPKLVIQKNQPITIRLKSTEPFHESEHPQWGKSYGYNVCVKNGDKYVDHTWWAKDAAKTILRVSRVVREEDFTLELRTGNSKDGKPYTIWLLDGKSANDWAAHDFDNDPKFNEPTATKEEFTEQIMTAVNETKVKEVVGEVVDFESLAADMDDIKKRVKFLEDQAGITEDEDIPF